ncbi:potassium-transporting ATPase KdpC subunit [Glutamicibacter uratoxydans]|uniref:Potassium-transporting ATPase KdpC subunit n=1 Tax=Glutamicibacter uratoxydans TaxID=43667 RepID=A0A4Y4DQV4_GLUUR|nr:potassium-transporting ATPase subunit KdpC [Glutamicibacter uratoxydans]GED05985.1 potassium-transporting ATPase KdpC subunit [Glutamicibacter uratoxydans]
MKFFSSSSSRTALAAVRAVAVLTLVLGLGYTTLVTGLGQLLLPAQANGSLITNEQSTTVGSALIGQAFTDKLGNPLPQYFQTRPSAAGEGYDGAASSGSNLGPQNPELIEQIAQRKKSIAEFNKVPEAQVPADAVTASASGLDPQISVQYAQIQQERVAAARGLDIAKVRALVEKYTKAPDLGFLGEPVVQVLELNLALDQLQRG